ncbi:MAG: hypothetical protein EOM76_12235, partial [Sphingobacteriia bacterium]|nr:hypothetical protein [Sphingobacteriia bacterium]
MTNKTLRNLLLLNIFIMWFGLIAVSQNSFQVAVLKYRGGGDWYANPTSLPNLILFCNQQLLT